MHFQIITILITLLLHNQVMATKPRIKTEDMNAHELL